MAQTKKKIPYRIKFRGAEYVLADVDIEQVKVPQALKNYNRKRFLPLQHALDESQGLASSLTADIDVATMRGTGIRDIIDLSEEVLLSKDEVWKRVATFNEKLANAVGKAQTLVKYLGAAADVAAQFDVLDPQLFNMNVAKSERAIKKFRPVTPDKELDQSFRNLLNLADARERLKKLDKEEQEG